MTKYVEVNAVNFISAFVTKFLCKTEMVKDVFDDGHYVLRISAEGIELAYPEDAPILTLNKSEWFEKLIT